MPKQSQRKFGGKIMTEIPERNPVIEIFEGIKERIQYKKFKFGFSKVCRKCPIGSNEDTRERNLFFCKNCESLAMSHYKQTGSIRFPFTLKFRR
jgi:hypothetical protein